ncbi:LCP family protein [Pseudonocardia endophytica]|uniref:LytR family transcriptional attenuator n=1 Tax=Pseudonocardia endophytica TaxID=401976 RepID=A0A4R1HUP9_PSEEN|nr:LCP family protein [Pseudonocardia endophytica]TCK25988.1 LytR family transcriptional attenuator [Pseudonocardia endophytica]
MHRRRQAEDSEADSPERDRAARLSGEIPIVPRGREAASPTRATVRPIESTTVRTTRRPGTSQGDRGGEPGSARSRSRSTARTGTAAAGSAAAAGAESPTRATRPPQRPPRSPRPGDAARAGATAAPSKAAAQKSKNAEKRRTPDTARRTLRAAIGLTAASTALPGTGHLAMKRRRTGGLILGTLALIVVTIAVLVLVLRRSTLLTNLLSPTALTVIAIALIVAGVAWIAVIARTYALARPRDMVLGKKVFGTGMAAVLCLVIAVPFGYGVDLLNSQRGLLESLFKGGGTDAAEALGKPRLNVLLLGSDAGPDRTGTRTDSMMLASIDTQTGRTTLFSLPRNIQRAQFPPGSPMAEKFPDGFHDPSQPLSGDYLLNAVYAYGETNPQEAPAGPTPFKGVNLLQSTISYMTGLPIDYYLEVNMAGFSSMIDAVGGVTVNVGSEPIPVGGVTAFGRHVKPDRYIQPGVQTLNGEDALWFARSRRDGTDYQRMGRQRCLIQAVINEKSSFDILARFQQIAAATKDTVYTDMPQQVLPALAVLADEGFKLESVAFDPTLPDPDGPNGTFDTADPDVPYMQEVVQKAIAPPPPLPADGAAPAPSTSASPSATPSSGPNPPPAASAAPQSVADACASISGAPAPGSAGEQTDGETAGASAPSSTPAAVEPYAASSRRTGN